MGSLDLPDDILFGIFENLKNPREGWYPKFPLVDGAWVLSLRLVCKRLNEFIMMHWLLRTIRFSDPTSRLIPLLGKPTSPSCIATVTRLLAGQVRAGRSKRSPLVNVIIRKAEDSASLLRNVWEEVNDVSSKRYADGLISAAVASLSPDRVLKLMARGTSICRYILKNLKKEPIKNSLQVALVAAASIGSIPEIKLLIDRGADVNSMTTFFSMPLHAAAFGGHTTAMKLILDKGADPKSEDLQQRRTPLHYAALAGNESAAALLIASSGVNPDALDSRDESPLFLAVTQGHAKVTALLLARESVNRDPKGGYNNKNALLYAVERNFVAVVKQLLEYPEVDVNAADPYFLWTPLAVAAKSGYVTMMELLLSHPDVNVNLEYREGKAPLDCACQDGQVDTVKLLLASPRVHKNARSGNFTPLIRAAIAGQVDVVRVLLACEDVDINVGTTEPGCGGYPVLARAVSWGRDDVVEVLLEDPRVELDNREGSALTPLMLAAGSWNSRTVQMLLGRNVDINAGIYGKTTPLIRAADKGDVILVTALLNHPDIQVNGPNDLGQTPLMVAARGGHMKIVRLLLNHPQTQVYVPDEDGVTALMYAASKGRQEVVELLLELGEVGEPTEEQIRRALGYAQESGKDRVVQLLSSRLNNSDSVGVH